MDAIEFLGRNYANAEDIEKAGLDNTPITIMDVVKQVFPAKEGKKEDRKLSLIIRGLEKPLILNKTNLKLLIASFGKDTDMWIGKIITPIVIPGEMNGQPIKRVIIKTT